MQVFKLSEITYTRNKFVDRYRICHKQYTHREYRGNNKRSIYGLSKNLYFWRERKLEIYEQILDYKNKFNYKGYKII